jgi:hypothetical protein
MVTHTALFTNDARKRQREIAEKKKIKDEE